MFKMDSAYTLENTMAAMGLPSSDYQGLSVAFDISTDSNPSDFSITLQNDYNKVSFRWNPDRAQIFISTYVKPSGNFDASNSGNGSWSGQQHSEPLSVPLSTIKIKFEVKGDYARAIMNDGSSTHEVSKTLSSSGSDAERNVAGWKVSVESRPVTGLETNTKIRNLFVTADSSSGGSIVIEHLTLTAEDEANKYVTIGSANVSYVSLNIAQATSQRRGVDFELVEDRIVWEGYGLDLPIMKEGVDIRVIYYSGAFGSPFFRKVGKRLVGVGEHGE